MSNQLADGIYKVKTGDFVTVIASEDPPIKIYKAPSYDLNYLLRGHKGRIEFAGTLDEMPAKAVLWGG